ncbi:hypothetical protein PtB15_5B439 [Puccinia triticina]|nr:hypothetical protein PtB15_5B439 [Puccinia triticina]
MSGSQSTRPDRQGESPRPATAALKAEQSPTRFDRSGMPFLDPEQALPKRLPPGEPAAARFGNNGEQPQNIVAHPKAPGFTDTQTSSATSEQVSHHAPSHQFIPEQPLDQPNSLAAHLSDPRGARDSEPSLADRRTLTGQSPFDNPSRYSQIPSPHPLPSRTYPVRSDPIEPSLGAAENQHHLSDRPISINPNANRYDAIHDRQESDADSAVSSDPEHDVTKADFVADRHQSDLLEQSFGDDISTDAVPLPGTGSIAAGHSSDEENQLGPAGLQFSRPEDEDSHAERRLFDDQDHPAPPAVQAEKAHQEQDQSAEASFTPPTNPSLVPAEENQSSEDGPRFHYDHPGRSSLPEDISASTVESEQLHGQPDQLSQASSEIGNRSTQQAEDDLPRGEKPTSVLPSPTQVQASSESDLSTHFTSDHRASSNLPPSPEISYSNVSSPESSQGRQSPDSRDSQVEDQFSSSPRVQHQPSDTSFAGNAPTPRVISHESSPADSSHRRQSLSSSSRDSQIENQFPNPSRVQHPPSDTSLVDNAPTPRVVSPGPPESSSAHPRFYHFPPYSSLDSEPRQDITNPDREEDMSRGYRSEESVKFEHSSQDIMNPDREKQLSQGYPSEESAEYEYDDYHPSDPSASEGKPKRKFYFNPESAGSRDAYPNEATVATGIGSSTQEYLGPGETDSRPVSIVAEQLPIAGPALEAHANDDSLFTKPYGLSDDISEPSSSADISIESPVSTIHQGQQQRNYITEQPSSPGSQHPIALHSNLPAMQQLDDSDNSPACLGAEEASKDNEELFDLSMTGHPRTDASQSPHDDPPKVAEPLGREPPTSPNVIATAEKEDPPEVSLFAGSISTMSSKPYLKSPSDDRAVDSDAVNSPRSDYISESEQQAAETSHDEPAYDYEDNSHDQDDFEMDHVLDEDEFMPPSHSSHPYNMDDAEPSFSDEDADCSYTGDVPTTHLSTITELSESAPDTRHSRELPRSPLRQDWSSPRSSAFQHGSQVDDRSFSRSETSFAQPLGSIGSGSLAGHVLTADGEQSLSPQVDHLNRSQESSSELFEKGNSPLHRTFQDFASASRHYSEEVPIPEDSASSIYPENVGQGDSLGSSQLHQASSVVEEPRSTADRSISNSSVLPADLTDSAHASEHQLFPAQSELQAEADLPTDDSIDYSSSVDSPPPQESAIINEPVPTETERVEHPSIDRKDAIEPAAVSEGSAGEPEEQGSVIQAAEEFSHSDELQSSPQSHSAKLASSGATEEMPPIDSHRPAEERGHVDQVEEAGEESTATETQILQEESSLEYLDGYLDDTSSSVQNHTAVESLTEPMSHAAAQPAVSETSNEAPSPDISVQPETSFTESPATVPSATDLNSPTIDHESHGPVEESRTPSESVSPSSASQTPSSAHHPADNALTEAVDEVGSSQRDDSSHLQGTRPDATDNDGSSPQQILSQEGLADAQVSPQDAPLPDSVASLAQPEKVAQEEAESTPTIETPHSDVPPVDVSEVIHPSEAEVSPQDTPLPESAASLGEHEEVQQEEVETTSHAESSVSPVDDIDAIHTSGAHSSPREIPLPDPVASLAEPEKFDQPADETSLITSTSESGVPPVEVGDSMHPSEAQSSLQAIPLDDSAPSLVEHEEVGQRELDLAPTVQMTEPNCSSADHTDAIQAPDGPSSPQGMRLDASAASLAEPEKVGQEEVESSPTVQTTEPAVPPVENTDVMQESDARAAVQDSISAPDPTEAEHPLNDTAEETLSLSSERAGEPVAVGAPGLAESERLDDHPAEREREGPSEPAAPTDVEISQVPPEVVSDSHQSADEPSSSPGTLQLLSDSQNEADPQLTSSDVKAETGEFSSDRTEESPVKNELSASDDAFEGIPLPLGTDDHPQEDSREGAGSAVDSQEASPFPIIIKSIGEEPEHADQAEEAVEAMAETRFDEPIDEEHPADQVAEEKPLAVAETPLPPNDLDPEKEPPNFAGTEDSQAPAASDPELSPEPASLVPESKTTDPAEETIVEDELSPSKVVPSEETHSKVDSLVEDGSVPSIAAALPVENPLNPGQAEDVGNDAHLLEEAHREETRSTADSSAEDSPSPIVIDRPAEEPANIDQAAEAVESPTAAEAGASQEELSLEHVDGDPDQASSSVQNLGEGKSQVVEDEPIAGAHIADHAAEVEQSPAPTENLESGQLAQPDEAVHPGEVAALDSGHSVDAVSSPQVGSSETKAEAESPAAAQPAASETSNEASSLDTSALPEASPVENPAAEPTGADFNSPVLHPEAHRQTEESRIPAQPGSPSSATRTPSPAHHEVDDTLTEGVDEIGPPQQDDPSHLQETQSNVNDNSDDSSLGRISSKDDLAGSAQASASHIPLPESVASAVEPEKVEQEEAGSTEAMETSEADVLPADGSDAIQASEDEVPPQGTPPADSPANPVEPEAQEESARTEQPAESDVTPPEEVSVEPEEVSVEPEEVSVQPEEVAQEQVEPTPTVQTTESDASEAAPATEDEISPQDTPLANPAANPVEPEGQEESTRAEQPAQSDSEEVSVEPEEVSVEQEEVAQEQVESTPTVQTTDPNASEATPATEDEISPQDTPLADPAANPVEPEGQEESTRDEQPAQSDVAPIEAPEATPSPDAAETPQEIPLADTAAPIAEPEEVAQEPEQVEPTPTVRTSEPDASEATPATEDEMSPQDTPPADSAANPAEPEAQEELARTEQPAESDVAHEQVESTPTMQTPESDASEAIFATEDEMSPQDTPLANPAANPVEPEGQEESTRAEQPAESDVPPEQVESTPTKQTTDSDVPPADVSDAMQASEAQLLPPEIPLTDPVANPAETEKVGDEQVEQTPALQTTQSDGAPADIADATQPSEAPVVQETVSASDPSAAQSDLETQVEPPIDDAAEKPTPLGSERLSEPTVLTEQVAVETEGLDDRAIEQEVEAAVPTDAKTSEAPSDRIGDNHETAAEPSSSPTTFEAPSPSQNEDDTQLASSDARAETADSTSHRAEELVLENELVASNAAPSDELQLPLQTEDRPEEEAREKACPAVEDHDVANSSPSPVIAEPLNEEPNHAGQAADAAEATAVTETRLDESIDDVQHGDQADEDKSPAMLEAALSPDATHSPSELHPDKAEHPQELAASELKLAVESELSPEPASRLPEVKTTSDRAEELVVESSEELQPGLGTDDHPQDLDRDGASSTEESTPVEASPSSVIVTNDSEDPNHAAEVNEAVEAPVITETALEHPIDGVQPVDEANEEKSPAVIETPLPPDASESKSEIPNFDEAGRLQELAASESNPAVEPELSPEPTCLVSEKESHTAADEAINTDPATSNAQETSARHVTREFESTRTNPVEELTGTAGNNLLKTALVNAAVETKPQLALKNVSKSYLPAFLNSPPPSSTSVPKAPVDPAANEKVWPASPSVSNIQREIILPARMKRMSAISTSSTRTLFMKDLATFAFSSPQSSTPEPVLDNKTPTTGPVDPTPAPPPPPPRVSKPQQMTSSLSTRTKSITSRHKLIKPYPSLKRTRAADSPDHRSRRTSYRSFTFRNKSILPMPDGTKGPNRARSIKLGEFGMVPKSHKKRSTRSEQNNDLTDAFAIIDISDAMTYSPRADRYVNPTLSRRLSTSVKDILQKRHQRSDPMIRSPLDDVHLAEDFHFDVERQLANLPESPSEDEFQAVEIETAGPSVERENHNRLIGHNARRSVDSKKSSKEGAVGDDPKGKKHRRVKSKLAEATISITEKIIRN